MKRLFLVDPVCAQPEGHNLTLLRSYRSYLVEQFSPSECHLVTSKQLPNNFEPAALRAFTFCYHGILKVSSLDDNFEFANMTEGEKEERATSEARTLLAEQAIGAGDVLFLPGGDYYGALGLLRAVSGLSAKKAPTLVIRYIGVLENIHGGNRSLQRLLNITEKLLAQKYPVRVTAETPLYTDYLSRSLGIPLTASPHPLFNKTNEAHPTAENRIVALPGSGRLDKGFDRVFEIAKYFSTQARYADVIFKLQSLPPQSLAENLRFGVRLYALPNVRILPAYLSELEMHELYASAHIVLSPYAQDVYAMRGSAVMVEAIDFGRLSVSQKRTGFASQLEYYGMGHTCETDHDYISAIEHYLGMHVEELDSRAEQARHRYQVDVAAAYRDLLR